MPDSITTDLMAKPFSFIYFSIYANCSTKWVPLGVSTFRWSVEVEWIIFLEFPTHVIISIFFKVNHQTMMCRRGI